MVELFFFLWLWKSLLWSVMCSHLVIQGVVKAPHTQMLCIIQCLSVQEICRRDGELNLSHKPKLGKSQLWLNRLENNRKLKLNFEISFGFIKQ